MSSSPEPTALSTHTLDSLCEELLRGGAVRLENGEDFRLSSPEARAVFGWYVSNREKWPRPNTRDDVEAIAARVEQPFPNVAEGQPASAGPEIRKLRLKTVRAHRFGGLHRFGKVEAAPEDFFHEFATPFTTVEGDNGAGKTSLLNAVVWCLTGHICRPNRPPESAKQPVPIAGGSPRCASRADATHVMSPVTPLPPEEQLAALGDKPLPLDTWVELEFTDESGAEVGKIRRKVRRAGKDSLTVTDPDFESIRLTPLAREIGTRMPALIPYIALDERSDLGAAVAELIGIRPLADLASHAEKSQKKLEGAFKTEREAALRAADGDFKTSAASLASLIAEHPAITPGATPPGSPEEVSDGSLEALRECFEARQAGMLADARAFLGDAAFDAADPSHRQGLVEHVGPALGALQASHLKKLPSAARLAKLGALSDETLSKAARLARQFQGEAVELAELAARPDLASRVRLYARVAGWLGESGAPPDPITACPVCDSPLQGKADAVTGRPVADHLREHLGEAQGVLHQTLEGWARQAVADLHRGLHETLSAELHKDLPAHPGDLIKVALGEELFEAECFTGCLCGLKSAAASLCREALEGLPPCDCSAEPELPACFDGPEARGLASALRRLSRAVAFARWRRGHADGCRAALDHVIGPNLRSDEEEGISDDGGNSMPIRVRLVALDRMVKTAAPLKDALTLVASMKASLSEREATRARLATYKRAAAALGELSGLGGLVDSQVEGLMKTLSAETARWKEALYTPAFRGAPGVTSTDVDGDGRLSFSSSAHGTAAPARHVSNASDLRATLLAFLLAFWQHLQRKEGGLSSLLLDEPQELFDAPNRRRLADALPKLAAEGAQVVVTTSCREFGRKLASRVPKRLGPGDIARWRIHPLRASREVVVLGEFAEAIEEKKRRFEAAEHENDPQPARDYINHLRIYLENRLLDLLDTDPPNKATLADLINVVRSRVNAGAEAFSGAAFRALVDDPAVAADSGFLSLVNQSHHGQEHLITFNEVAQEKGSCSRVRRLVETAHEEYERWLRRDPGEPAGVKPGSPPVLPMPEREVRVFEQLAAFTRDAPPAEVYETGEEFSLASLSRHACYLVNTHNYGFAAPLHSHVLVELEGDDVEDGRLVIALYGDNVYARRLHRDVRNPTVVVLSSETEDPDNRPPSLFLPATRVRLLKVVGVILADGPPARRPKGEATLAEGTPRIGKAEVAFRVRGDSALPLAVPGQLVLGGEPVIPALLKETGGGIVAIATSEGAALKRVGAAVPGAGHVVQFESVGGKGESMLARVEEPEDDPFSGLPLVQSARRIIGILYV